MREVSDLLQRHVAFTNTLAASAAAAAHLSFRGDADPDVVVGVMKNEKARLELWHKLALYYYRNGQRAQFVSVLETVSYLFAAVTNPARQDPANPNSRIYNIIRDARYIVIAFVLFPSLDT